MVMSWVWVGILCISVLCGVALGNGSALGAAVAQGAQAGVTLAVSIAGSICLWSGVGKLMERSGMTGFLSKLLSPLLFRIFPTTKKDSLAGSYLSANICANILGLGNAATPMGIQAAKRLADPNRPGLATDELCRLIVLNTASIQLIPANVAAVRASLGAAAPFDILPAVWITSICSAALGLTAAWGLGAIFRHD
ncbi:MAG: spore maturation protein A [Ruminococcaceae bacterium]|nr:spore maturation protein A [Oscillospiraceae bacterium]